MNRENFDPYRQWLGIETEQRPVDHYQLLGLDRFESNPARIEEAVKRRSATLQMITGPDADQAQKLLQQIGAARLCLLDDRSRAVYDRELEEDQTLELGRTSEPLHPDRTAEESADLQGTTDDHSESASETPPPIPPRSENGTPQRDAFPNLKPVQEAGDSGQPSVTEIPAENPSNEFQQRVASQRAREAQDQQIKIWLDRILWASCGVCLIAICVVIIVRTSGCNQEAERQASGESQADDSVPAVDSNPLAPQKKLSHSLLSPLEKEQRNRLNQVAGTEKKRKSSPGGKGPGKSTPEASDSMGAGGAGGAGFVEIRQTLGRFDFAEPVNGSDLIGSLLPLRLNQVDWKKEGDRGCLEFSDKSSVIVDRDKAFENLKALTILCRFRSKANRPQTLFSVGNRLKVAILGTNVTVESNGKKVDGKHSGSLTDDRWHALAVTLGAENTGIWLDGKELTRQPVGLPDLHGDNLTARIGAAGGKKMQKFIGRIDLLGFYWIELDSAQILSQFSR